MTLSLCGGSAWLPLSLAVLPVAAQCQLEKQCIGWQSHVGNKGNGYEKHFDLIRDECSTRKRRLHSHACDFVAGCAGPALQQRRTMWRSSGASTASATALSRPATSPPKALLQGLVSCSTSARRPTKDATFCTALALSMWHAVCTGRYQHCVDMGMQHATSYPPGCIQRLRFARSSQEAPIVWRCNVFQIV